MIINTSELQIILNELHRRGKKELLISSYLGNVTIGIIDLEKMLFIKGGNKKNWVEFIDEVCSRYNLTEKAVRELPNYDDIIRAIISSGLYYPEGLDGLIEDINHYLSSKMSDNRRKRVIIALDTNQLIYNTMSQYIEKKFASDNPSIRHFISYLVSSWVIEETNSFIKSEKNSAAKELLEKLKPLSYNLAEKYDKYTRLGYSILAELKSLETAIDFLESTESDKRKQEITNNKDEKDIAIINEYHNYYRNLKNTKFYFVTSDEQAKVMAKVHFDIVSIKYPFDVPIKRNCTLEQSAILLYQLTLLFGYLKINYYGIEMSIFFGGKNPIDWEKTYFKFECIDIKFEKQIEKLIKLTRKMNGLF